MAYKNSLTKEEASRHRPRNMALTKAHVARVERPEPDPGPEEGLTPLADHEYVELARDLLRQKPDQFWVFAYGSLIWDAAFDHIEARTCVAHGWRRSFCIEIFRWRGSADRPGLMMALDRGGSCVGVAFRMPDDDHLGRIMRLLDREIEYHDDISYVRWIKVRSGGERFTALAFWASPPKDDYFVRLPIEKQASVLARAVGHWGSGAAYLHNTVQHLEQLGIRDSYLWKLQHLVADEIDCLYPELGVSRGS